MSILGKIVGQLENVGDGSSGGSSFGMNYINTPTFKIPYTGHYYGGVVIAKLAEDNKVYKFDIVAHVESNGLAYFSGFTFNKEVVILYAKTFNTICLAHFETRDDNRLLICLDGSGDKPLQLEGYTTITPEEVVQEEPATSNYNTIEFSKALVQRIEALESA